LCEKNHFAQDIIEFLNKLSSFFKKAKNVHKFEQTQLELGYTNVMKLKLSHPIRWTSDYDLVHTSIQRMDAIVKTLILIESEDKNISSEEASCALRKMSNQRFAAALCLLHEILAIFHEVSVLSQSETENISFIQRHIRIGLEDLKSLSADSILQKANLVNSTIFRFLHRSIVLPECHSAIDDCLSSCTLFLEKELEKRFSNVMIEKIKMFDCLTPSSKSYLDEDKILILAREYKESHKIDCTLLKHEVFRLSFCVSNGEHNGSTFLPNLFILFQIFNSMPLTTATVERTFSTVNRVVSRLRTSMTSKRSSDLCLISHEASLLKIIKDEEILEEWKNSRERLLPL